MIHQKNVILLSPKEKNKKMLPHLIWFIMIIFQVNAHVYNFISSQKLIRQHEQILLNKMFALPSSMAHSLFHCHYMHDSFGNGCKIAIFWPWRSSVQFEPTKHIKYAFAVISVRFSCTKTFING